jgi:hypothetical protein
MSSVAFPGTNLSSVSQLNATARTGPEQEQNIDQTGDLTVGQAPPAFAEDTVKLSAGAQAQAMHQSGQSVSSIASSLGTSVSTVDSYLGITVAVSVPLTAAPAAKAAPATSAAATAAPKVDVKA